MQLPFFSLDPVQSAKQCPIKWKLKLGVEAAQLVASCYTKEELAQAPRTTKGTVRSNASHPHHPVTKWVRASLDNFLWALQFGVACCEEVLSNGLAKSQHHLSFFKWCVDNWPDLPDAGWTEPYKMEGYDHLPLLESYYAYFNEEKQHLAEWDGDVPDWFEEVS